MSQSRALILERVRRSQPAASPLPEVPSFERAPASLLASFIAALTRMGGVFVEPPSRHALDGFLFERFPQARVVCSATPEVVGTRPVASVAYPSELQDVDVGVVRAVFGVAETGSVWLSERELRLNALAFLSQHLVVLLDPRDIVENLHHAYRHRGFHEARCALLLSGPTTTADIEGVLIRGAQGIRSLTVMSVKAP